MNPRLRAAALVAVVLVLDQVAKILVRADVTPGSRRELLPGVDLVNTRNTGVAFSLFRDSGAVLVIFTILAMVAVLVFFLSRPERRGAWLPTGLLLGGAAGNLIDRLRDGGVTDFIDLPRWPAFNLADMAITVGVVLLIFVLERRDDG